MTTRAPAQAGMRLEEVDTPALILDLDAFETNLKRLALARTIVASPHLRFAGIHAYHGRARRRPDSGINCCWCRGTATRR